MSITPSRKDRSKGRFALGCFFSFFLLFGLAMSTFLFLVPLFHIVGARNWREVPCTILASKVETHRGSKGGATYSVEVTYEYVVDDECRVGTRYQFMGGSSSGYDGKKAIVDRLPPGTRTVCYVDRRDPAEAVLERGFTADLLFGLIPLVFALVGAGGLVGVFVHRGRPPVPGAAPGGPAAARTATAAPARGPVRLKTSSSPAARFGCLLVFALFWNGIVSVFAVQAWSGWRGGHGDGCATVFLLPFVLVGLLLVGLSVHGFLAMFNPRPTLRLGSPSVALGDLVEVEWETAGNVDRVRAFSITLEGREEATYKRGTSQSTDKSTFAVIPLARANRGRDLRRGRAKFTVPADSMHSWKSGHNKFVWAIHVRGDIPWWPDIGEEFPIEVLPQRAAPGGDA